MEIYCVLCSAVLFNVLGAVEGLRPLRNGPDDHITIYTINGNVTVPRRGLRTVGDLRNQLKRKYNTDVDLFRKGQQANDDEPIGDTLSDRISMAVPIRGGMRVQVQTMQGQKIEVDVEANETVLDLKKKLSNKQKMPVDQQRIIFEGKMLQDNKTLAEYNIKNNSVIHMVLRLRGGDW